MHLFYCNETKDLAQNIAAITDSIHLNPINWRNFADGFPNLFIPNAYGIRGQHVTLLTSFSSHAVIFEKLSIIYALPMMFLLYFALVLCSRRQKGQFMMEFCQVMDAIDGNVLKHFASCSLAVLNPMTAMFGEIIKKL